MKITLNNVGDLAQSTTAATTINNNSAVIATAFDNTLSRDGTSPNTMGSDFDMNSNRILNLPAPLGSSEPLRLQDLTQFNAGGTIATIPAGGTTGQVLGKLTNTNYSVGWINESSQLVAGTNIQLSGATPTTISVVPSPTFAGTVTAAGLSGPLASGTVITNPVINGTSTGTGVSPAAVASTLALRDANATVTSQGFLNGSAVIATAAGTTTLTAGSGYNQVFTGATTQTVVLPVASTLGVGQCYRITNQSTGLVTVNSSGGNTVTIMPGSANATALITCVLNSGTTAASWAVDANYVNPTNGKRLAFTNTLTLSGTDGSTLNVGAGGTLATSATTDTTNAANITSGTLPTARLSSTGVPAQIGAVSTVKKQVFTATGTYNPSTGMLYCVIECVGGGGGGGGSNNASATQIYGGGGGGSGGYSRLLATAATIGASKAVTIGTAGNGGAAGSNNGTAGGDTSVGVLCIGKGGSPGLFASIAQVPTGGAGGVAGTGDLTPAGTGGGFGGYSTTNNTFVSSGTGGSSAFGGGAPATATSAGSAAAGVAGGSYGAGGSGGHVNSFIGTAAGGNGSAGVVIITEFCNQ